MKFRTNVFGPIRAVPPK